MFIFHTYQFRMFLSAYAETFTGYIVAQLVLLLNQWKTCLKILGEVELTLMLAVPRVLDRIYTKINNGIRGASAGSRRLIEWAIAIGTKVFHLRSHKRDIPPIVLLQHWIA